MYVALDRIGRKLRNRTTTTTALHCAAPAGEAFGSAHLVVVIYCLEHCDCLLALSCSSCSQDELGIDGFLFVDQMTRERERERERESAAY
jgi:hypothetical protein